MKCEPTLQDKKIFKIIDGYRSYLHDGKERPDLNVSEMKSMVTLLLDESSRQKEREIENYRKANQEIDHEIRESFNALDDIMVIVGSDFRIQRINNKGLALIGADESKVLGCKCHEAIHGLSRPKKGCPLLTAKNTGKPASIETFENKWDKHFSITCSPVVNEDGSIEKFVDFIRDITEQKENTNRMKKLANLFNLVLENGSLFVGIIDKNGVYTSCKGSALVRMGLPASITDFKRLLDTIPDLAKAISVVRKGTLVSFETNGSYGGKRWYVSNHLFPDVQNPGGAIHLGFDITDNMQQRETAQLREKQLIQAEKLTSLGSLVAGIAHEINNPNMFMGMGSENLSLFFHQVRPVLDAYDRTHPEWCIAGHSYRETRETVERIVQGMKDGSQRINRIIRALKDFVRPNQESTHRAVDLIKVINDTIEIVRNKIKKSTGYFTFTPGTSVPCCRGNPQQIEQIIMNLLTNACEALTDQNQKITVYTDFVPTTSMTRITVRDEGIGISPENLPKIAQPFFTTKQVSGGLGIGLSITFDLVRANNGMIHYESQPKTGTTVTVELPAWNQ